MTQSGIWIIGYGSLIFKPPPLYAFKVTGTINGYIRRFWQSSSDHRGTPQAPGRVATLIPLSDIVENESFHKHVIEFELANKNIALSLLTEEDLTIWGVAYYIEPKNVNKVKDYLDVREQDGYSTHLVHFNVHSVPVDDVMDGAEGNGVDCAIATDVLSRIPRDLKGRLTIESTVYIGTIHNESFVGPEDLGVTAKVISASKGPSGRNIEYLAMLASAVNELEPADGQSTDLYLESLLKDSLALSQ